MDNLGHIHIPKYVLLPRGSLPKEPVVIIITVDPRPIGQILPRPPAGRRIGASSFPNRMSPCHVA